jgi:hypothetical protein
MTQARNLVPMLSLCLVALMAGSWWLGRRSAQTQHLPPVPSQSGPGNASGTAPAEEEADTRTFAVVLCRGLVRGNEEGSKPLVIPPKASQVRLEARVAVAYPRYEVVLQTAENKRILSKGDLEAEAFPSGRRIFLYVSRTMLPPGDYVLTVHGVPASGRAETAAEYSFRVGAAELEGPVPVSAGCTGSQSAHSNVINS